MAADPAAAPQAFPTAEAQERERERLFRLLEQLVNWENTMNQKVVERAREETLRGWRRACADNSDHSRAGPRRVK